MVFRKLKKIFLFMGVLSMASAAVLVSTLSFTNANNGVVKYDQLSSNRAVNTETELNTNFLSLNGLYYELNSNFVTLDWNNKTNLTNQIKQLMINEWKDNLWINIPDDITSNDIEITIQDYSAVDGFVSISNITLLRYYNSIGDITSEPRNFIPNSRYLKIYNVLRVPTKFNLGTDLDGIGTIQQPSDNLITWNASLFYANKSQSSSINYSNTLPSDFLKDELNCLITSWDIRNKLLVNVPTNSSFDATLSNRVNSDNHGYIEYDLTLKGINDSNGYLTTSYGSIIKLRLIGLATGSTDTRVNTSVLENGINATQPIINYSTNQIVGLTSGTIYNNIKEWIIEKFNDIFTNYSITYPTIDEIVSMSIEANDRESVFINISLKNCVIDGNISQASFKFKITGFNSSFETTLNPNVNANGISATNPVNKFITEDLISNKSQNIDILKKWIIDNFDSIFVDYPSSTPTIADISSIQIYANDKIKNSVIVQLSLANARNNDGSIGEKFFNFVLLDLTTPQDISSLKSNVNISELLIPSINKDIYTIDIVDSSLSKNYQNEIINSINNNPNFYINNPPLTSLELNGRKIVNPDYNTTFTINQNPSYITLNLQYLQRTNNPNNPAIYKNGSIIIEGFNTNETKLNDNVIANGISIESLNQFTIDQMANNSIIKEIIQSYIRNNQEIIFDNISKKFIESNFTELTISNISTYQKYGYITVDINTTYALSNNKFINKTFNSVVIKGFSVSQTTTKQINAEVIDSTSKNDPTTFNTFLNTSKYFAYDFVELINNYEHINKLLIKLINTYPDAFLENPANVSNVVEQNTKLKAILNPDKTSINIVGKFYQIKSQSDSTFSQYEEMSITINNFNSSSTTIITSAIDIEKVLGSNKIDFSTTSALETFRKNVKIFIAEVLEKKDQIFLNQPSNFSNKLAISINDVAFKIVGDNVFATIQDVPVAINGVVELSRDIEIDLGQFNSFTIFTQLKLSSIDANTTAGQTLFNQIFNDFGWEDDWKLNDFTTRNQTLLKYMNLNYNSFFKNTIPSVQPVLSVSINRTNESNVLLVDLEIDGYQNGNRTRFKSQMYLILKKFNSTKTFSNFGQYLQDRLLYENIPESSSEATKLIKMISMEYLSLLKNQMPYEYFSNNASDLFVEGIQIKNNTILIPPYSNGSGIWFINKNNELIPLTSSSVTIKLNDESAKNKNVLGFSNNSIFFLIMSAIGIIVIFGFIVGLLIFIFRKTSSRRIV